MQHGCRRGPPPQGAVSAGEFPQLIAVEHGRSQIRESPTEARIPAGSPSASQESRQLLRAGDQGHPAAKRDWKQTKSFTFRKPLWSQSAYGSAAAKRDWKHTKSF